LRGFREPHKFVGLVTLAYCIFFAYGAANLSQRWHKVSETVATSGAVAVCVLPVLLAPTMFWGGLGQLQASHYPDDWYAANTYLNQDADTFQTLFVPWHQYMSYSFAGRNIATPAPAFFQKPMIVSEDPELAGAQALTITQTSRDIGALLARQPTTDSFGAQLQPYNVKYILVAKEHDYQKYRNLADQQDLAVIRDTATLTLYRNESWRPQ
ncbi:MAG TPA: alpha-(1-_3)-arabinofuranosyltransferase family protein, partial [Candidatus Saccharimonadales bacterium]|nr:alpha-(1->3)-arabinofuranosyltransferase family protein [Candidatus Saccharimonadales bacterium]